MNFNYFLLLLFLNYFSYISSSSPTRSPSRFPSLLPTLSPTLSPTLKPTLSPSLLPSLSPTSIPTNKPTYLPTNQPTYKPTNVITLSPTSIPTLIPIQYNWNNSFTSFYSDGEGTNQVQIIIKSNREIYRNLGGHFKLLINATSSLYGNLNTTSECIEIGIGVAPLIKLIKKSTLKFVSKNYTELLGTYMNVLVKKYGDGKIGSNFQTHYNFTITSSTITNIAITISKSGCVEMQTIGLWSDPRNWETGIIPNKTNSVYIPHNAGFIQLDQNIQIASLNIHGGTIIAHNSPCPYGWSLSSPNNKLGKCYKLFEDEKTYLKADEVCRGQGKNFGTLGTSLVQIEDYTELNTVRGLCRSNRNSIAYNTGCWIGLQDANGTGYFNWRDPVSMLDLSFRNWRRRSDRSDRLKLESPSPFINNGDNCVHLVPWQNDPLYQEEGAFREVSCIDEPKAFICQMSVVPKRYTITLTQYSTFLGGSLYGGHLKLYNSFNITNFIVNSTATITSYNSNIIGFIDQLVLLDGSTFILGTNAQTKSESLIGEYSINSNSNSNSNSNNTMFGQQPLFKILDGISLTCQSLSSSNLNYNVIINARIEVGNGNIFVGNNVYLHLLGGGDISRSNIHLNSHSQLIIDGYAMRMMTYDAFDLTLSHRGEVIGEYTNNIINEKNEELQSRIETKLKGVYRLIVYSSSSSSSSGQITRCIPYNSTAVQLQEILDELSIIHQLGGSTVRLMTEGDYRFNYGYNYRIELDSPDQVYYTNNQGRINIELYCIGILNCNCAQTKVSYIDEYGQKSCPLSGNTSRIDPSACAIPPNIIINRISYLDYTNITGKGELTFISGTHRLPSITTININIIGTSKCTIGSNLINWKSINLGDTGKVIYTGKGWEGWDSSILIFSSFDTRGRGESSLNNAPSFILKISSVILNDGSSFLTSGPGSILNWMNLTWNGGIIGGRSTIYINKNLLASQTGKSLRYSCILHILEDAKFTWSSGNISLHNGAQIIIEGILIVDVYGSKQYFGFAELLSMPSSSPYQYLLDSEPQYNNIIYFDDQLPEYLRDGYYINPLCGETCLTPVTITFINNGKLIALPYSNSTFVAPINLQDNSRLEVQTSGELTAQSGGGCGNNVYMEISDSAVIELSGGTFFMGSTCTITGTGELLGTAGMHDLSFSINAHITISGGVMRWPLSRGNGLTIQFFGGLVISGEGQLLVEPWSTNIKVNKVVHFKDNCLLQFPMIGTAAQPSVYDTLDAPDLSPRGVLTAIDVMKWEGGTLRGKADIIANKTLFLFGGTKYIRSLSKLINKGHAEWSEGDIIMADQADFVNLGTVQMTNGSALFNGNNLVEGTIIPVENGGDPFALQYHSWDLDQGGLDFEEYVRLRTLYVSRAPVGWTEELDGKV